MKKLLILGGSRYVLPVIRVAHQLGCYVITCDFLPDNIAHKYSDEYCNVSIIDKNAVLEAAQQLHIDGITSFACDPGVATAAYVAEKMGLPSAGSYEAISILQNKGRFRKFLADNGFNVPTAKSYTEIDEALEDVLSNKLFSWPIIVKPTDSAGSKGVTRVEEQAQLRKSIENALKYSHCDEFIIEDFLQQNGFSSDTDCFSVNGELKFVSFDCQRFDIRASNPFTPSAYSWPSSMTLAHQQELAMEIQRLIKLLGLGTSIYNIETRECVNGKAYIMECSPRGGGNRLAECLEYATGVKLIENTVRAALGMAIVDMEQRPYKGAWAEIVLHSEHEGIFDELWISDLIKGYVVEHDLWVTSGDKVFGFSAANEAIGTLILRFDTQEQIHEVLSNQSKYLKVRLK